MKSESKYYTIVTDGTDQISFRSVKEAKSYIESLSAECDQVFTIKRNNKTYGVYHWDSDLNMLVGRRLS